jgi:hypothetical protein
LLFTSYDMGVRYVLQSERMGHEVPGMRGVYAHITTRMRAELKAGLQELWEASFHERALISDRSAVAVLDGLLPSRRSRQIWSLRLRPDWGVLVPLGYCRGRLARHGRRRARSGSRDSARL